ncbi:hypothetical protein MTP99_018258 [Tenebrio molitor]|nr:hypothetical protein MTP99_018258 [Tenebrio molitor]
MRQNRVRNRNARTHYRARDEGSALGCADVTPDAKIGNSSVNDSEMLTVVPTVQHERLQFGVAPMEALV